MRAVSVSDLSALRKEPHPPLLIDVRRTAARKASGLTLEDATWRDPAQWLDWKDEVAATPRAVVFFCAHGHEISQGLTAALCAMGKDASYLEGGFAQWHSGGLKVVAVASVA
jgi:rhodanese-related sulfurtransferase